MPKRREVKYKSVTAGDQATRACIGLINKLWWGKIRPPFDVVVDGEVLVTDDFAGLGPNEAADVGKSIDAIKADIRRRGWSAVNLHNAKIVNNEFKAQVQDMQLMRMGTGVQFADLWSAERWRKQDQEDLNFLIDQVKRNEAALKAIATVQDEGERQQMLMDEFFLPMLTAGSELNPASAYMCRPQLLMNHMLVGYELNSFSNHAQYMADSIVESTQELLARARGGAMSILPFIAVGALVVIALKK